MIADRDQDFAERSDTKAPRPASPMIVIRGKCPILASDEVKRKSKIQSLHLSGYLHFYIFPFPHGKSNSPRLLLLNRYSYFFFFGLKAFMA